MAERSTTATPRRSRPPLWLVEGLDVVEQRRAILLTVTIAAVVVGLGLALFVPGLVPPVPAVGAAVAIAAMMLGLAATLAIDTADLTVRGPRHVGAAGGELVAVLPVEARPEAAAELAAAVLDAREGDGTLLLGLSAAGRDTRHTAAWTDALAVSLVHQGVSVLRIDLASGRSEPPGLVEVVRDDIKLARAVSFEPELLLARLGAGRDHLEALEALAELTQSLPRDLEVLLVALPTAASRQVVEAARVLDHMLIVAERDRTSRVELIAGLDALESAGTQAQVALLDDRTASRLARVVDTELPLDDAPDPADDAPDPADDAPDPAEVESTLPDTPPSSSAEDDDPVPAPDPMPTRVPTSAVTSVSVPTIAEEAHPASSAEDEATTAIDAEVDPVDPVDPVVPTVSGVLGTGAAAVAAVHLANREPSDAPEAEITEPPSEAAEPAELEPAELEPAELEPAEIAEPSLEEAAEPEPVPEAVEPPLVEPDAGEPRPASAAAPDALEQEDALEPEEAAVPGRDTDVLMAAAQATALALTATPEVAPEVPSASTTPDGDELTPVAADVDDVGLAVASQRGDDRGPVDLTSDVAAPDESRTDGISEVEESLPGEEDSTDEIPVVVPPSAISGPDSDHEDLLRTTGQLTTLIDDLQTRIDDPSDEQGEPGGQIGPG